MPKIYPAFKDFDTILYGSCTVKSPIAIIEMDNNFDILRECRNGLTKDKLIEKGISITDSQLFLLKDWRLLKEDGNILKTSYPIIDGEKSMRLRKLIHEKSEKIGEQIKEDVKNIVNILETSGFENNSYSILFSYVIDGIVWNELKEAKEISDSPITAQKPHWRGTVYSIYPKKIFRCGTNNYYDEGLTLYLHWSNGAIDLLRPHNGSFSDYERFYTNIYEHNKVVDRELIDKFSPMGLVDISGNITFPVINKNSDKLFLECTNLSEKIGKCVYQELNLDALMLEFEMSSPGETLVVLYHELMWEVLDYLEVSGLVKKPIAFSNPDKALKSDARDLLFIIKD